MSAREKWAARGIHVEHYKHAFGTSGTTDYSDGTFVIHATDGRISGWGIPHSSLARNSVAWEAASAAWRALGVNQRRVTHENIAAGFAVLHASIEAA